MSRLPETPEEVQELKSWLICLAFSLGTGFMCDAKGADWPILYLLYILMYRTRKLDK